MSMNIPGSRQSGGDRRLPLRIRAERLLPLITRMKRWLVYTGAALTVLLVTAFGFLFYLRMQSLPATSISQTSQMLDLQLIQISRLWCVRTLCKQA